MNGSERYFLFDLQDVEHRSFVNFELIPFWEAANFIRFIFSDMQPTANFDDRVQ